MAQHSQPITPVIVRDMYISWGRMFNLVGKFVIVASIYGVVLGIISTIFWIAVLQAILDSNG